MMHMPGSINEEISAIMELIRRSELDAAKKRVTALAPNMKTDRMRGVLAAVNGLVVSLTKKKEGSLQAWDEEKVLRAAHQIMKGQVVDDFDKGFSETLAKYGKLLKSPKSRE